MVSENDIKKILLLKKFSLLSLFKECLYGFGLDDQSDEISNQIKKIESKLFFIFFGNIIDEFYDPENEEYNQISVDSMYNFLGKTLSTAINFNSDIKYI